MLRDKNLVLLSRQHQHALALCVRIDRASPVREDDLKAWQIEIAQQFQTEIAIHFASEEQVLFPAARRFKELAPLVEELLADHAVLHGHFKQAETQGMSATDLSQFAGRLSGHIRKEERQLFERLQGLMNQEELALLGNQLDDALKEATQSCAVPGEATKLRPAK